MEKPRKKRVSRDQWLQTALEMFAASGEGGLHIEKLARALGVAKSGFYFHFRDREDLLQHLIAYWAHEYTEVVTQNPLLLMAAPRERLTMIATLVFEENLTEFEAAMQVWSNKDAKIAIEVDKVVNKRRTFVNRAFRELGFEGEEITARTRIFLGYITGERQVFGSGKKAARSARELLINMLTER